MRKLKYVASTILLAGVLVGCSDKEEVTDVPADVENNEAYAFNEFSLDVDYSATSSYEASYDNENNKTEAEIDDTVNNEKLTGDDAFSKLDPMLKSLTFDANTSNDDVIAQVLSAFGLEDNYTKFDLDVRFNDGTEKEYVNTK